MADIKLSIKDVVKGICDEQGLFTDKEKALLTLSPMIAVMEVSTLEESYRIMWKAFKMFDIEQEVIEKLNKGND